jgi:phosphoglycolate phosphatase
MVETLIFDFDGTIVDSLQFTFEIFRQLAGEYGFNKPDLKDMERYRRMGGRVMIKEWKIPIYKMPSMAKRFRQEFEANGAKLKPFSGLVEALHALKTRGVTLGILTSNSEANARDFLKNNHMELFDFVYGGSSLFGKDKVLKKLLKDKKLMADKAVYVGDEPRDIEAAHKCGVKVAVVTWGFSTRELLAVHQPDWLISQPADLLGFV